jgi:polysaccharide pyruvyl transferase WcaK-like protein
LADYASFRDALSIERALELGIPASRDSVVPDLALSLPRELVPEASPIQWPPKRIGIGVMGYKGWNRPKSEADMIYGGYIQRLGRLVEGLLDRGYLVRFLIGDLKADPRAVEALDRAVASRFRRTDQLVIELAADFGQLMRQIAETDLVVASRYHNIVLGLLLGRPAISLSYAPKNDAVLEMFGMGNGSEHIERFDAEDVLASVERLSRDSDPSTHLRSTLRDLQTRLERQYQELAVRLRG